MRSGEFRLGRAKCFLLMMTEQAPWIGWTLLILVVGLAVAGFIFSPWLGIAALGVDAFIIMMALTLVIMGYGFNSITGVNMPLHTLAIDGDTVRAEFEDGKAVEVARRDLRPYKIYPGGVLVPVVGPRSGWLWVTPKAFDTDGDFKDFMKKLYESHTE